MLSESRKFHTVSPSSYSQNVFRIQIFIDIGVSVHGCDVNYYRDWVIATLLNLRPCYFHCKHQKQSLYQLPNGGDETRRRSPVRSSSAPVSKAILHTRNNATRIRQRGHLTMIALFWLSASENKVFILYVWNISRLIEAKKHPPPPPPPPPTSPLLVLIRRHGLPMHPAPLTGCLQQQDNWRVWRAAKQITSWIYSSHM